MGRSRKGQNHADVIYEWSPSYQGTQCYVWYFNFFFKVSLDVGALSDSYFFDCVLLILEDLGFLLAEADFLSECSNLVLDLVKSGLEAKRLGWCDVLHRPR